MCSPVTTGCATTCEEFRIKRCELWLCGLGDVSALARGETFSSPMLMGALRADCPGQGVQGFSHYVLEMGSGWGH